MPPRVRARALYSRRFRFIHARSFSPCRDPDQLLCNHHWTRTTCGRGVLIMNEPLRTQQKRRRVIQKNTTGRSEFVYRKPQNVRASEYVVSCAQNYRNRFFNRCENHATYIMTCVLRLFTSCTSHVILDHDDTGAYDNGRELVMLVHNNMRTVPWETLLWTISFREIKKMRFVRFTDLNV
jgi:hypothetical protein